jgi:hypothetical protein
MSPDISERSVEDAGVQVHAALESGGKTVCVVSCQRSPEPLFLKWKGLEA